MASNSAKRSHAQASSTDSTVALDNDAQLARQAKRAMQARIDELAAANRQARVCGQVQCAKLPYRFAKPNADGTSAARWPQRDGFQNANVCSSGQSYRALSPMLLGPVRFRDFDVDGVEREYEARCLENLWQFSKVWADDVDEATGAIKPEWFAWRDAGWRDSKAHRHPRRVGRVDYRATNPSYPLYHYWRGERVPYLEARVRLYIPHYVRLAERTLAYRQLRALVHERAVNVQVLGYDGRDFEAQGDTLRTCLRDASKPFGHELVLVGMLRDERAVWEEHEAWRSSE